MTTVNIGELEIVTGGAPCVCTSIMGEDLEAIAASARRAAEAPVNLIEWRVDRFTNADDPASVRRAIALLKSLIGKLPLLATVRTTDEGGSYSGSREAYTALVNTLLETGSVDAVDIELARAADFGCSIAAKAAELGAALVLSYHNFSSTPPCEKMLEIIRTMQELGCDIAKIAVMPRSSDDVLELLKAASIARDEDRTPVAAISMGRLGMISRLAGGIFGSVLTFCSAGEESAPGQPDAQLLNDVFKALY